jgi:hypothetical protein
MGIPKSGDWNMNDYKKLEATHFLSAYEIKIPVWQGTTNARMPFGQPVACFPGTKHIIMQSTTGMTNFAKPISETFSMQ